MSKIQAKPLIESILGSLTNDQLVLLGQLINGSQSTPTFRSLTNPANYITDSDKGVKYLSLETKDKVLTGYFIYNNTYCVILVYSKNTQNMNIFEIDIEEEECRIVAEPLSILELRAVLGLDQKADLVGGVVPASQLPSYVDDVVEYPTESDFPEEGESDKIYIALDTGWTYRWTGSQYVRINTDPVYVSGDVLHVNEIDTADEPTEVSDITDGTTTLPIHDARVPQLQEDVAGKQADLKIIPLPSNVNGFNDSLQSLANLNIGIGPFQSSRSYDYVLVNSASLNLGISSGMSSVVPAKSFITLAVRTYGGSYSITFTHVSNATEIGTINSKECTGVKCSVYTSNSPTQHLTQYNVAQSYLSGLDAFLCQEFSKTSTYEIGDFVSYHGFFYKCIDEVTTPDFFDSSKWTIVNIDEVYAKKSGYYPDLIAGKADNLSSNLNQSITEAFLFQSSGGSAEVSTGTAKLTKLIGNTVLFNQLVGPSTSVVSTTNGHKYLMIVDDEAAIFTSSGQSIATTGGVDQVFDLTAMFLEGNEPESVEDFKAMFPKPYYEYDAGTFKSAKVNKYVTVGRNQYSGLNTFIRVVSGTEYRLEGVTDGSLVEFDGSQTQIKSTSVTGDVNITLSDETVYVKVQATTYSDICLFIHWDDTEDGNYVAYEKNEYTLPDIELLSFGDVKDELLPDGTITRNVGTKAYASGDESNPAYWTDGTISLYAQVPATTSQVPAYAFESDTAIDNWGTQEFVSSSTIPAPQMCNIEYYANLKDFVEASYIRTEGDVENFVTREEADEEFAKQDGTYEGLFSGNVYTDTQIGNVSQFYMRRTCSNASTIDGLATVRKISGHTTWENNVAKGAKFSKIIATGDNLYNYAETSEENVTPAETARIADEDNATISIEFRISGTGSDATYVYIVSDPAADATTGTPIPVTDRVWNGVSKSIAYRGFDVPAGNYGKYIKIASPGEDTMIMRVLSGYKTGMEFKPYEENVTVGTFSDELHELNGISDYYDFSVNKKYENLSTQLMDANFNWQYGGEWNGWYLIYKDGVTNALLNGDAQIGTNFALPISHNEGQHPSDSTVTEECFSLGPNSIRIWLSLEHCSIPQYNQDTSGTWVSGTIYYYESSGEYIEDTVIVDQTTYDSELADKGTLYTKTLVANGPAGVAYAHSLTDGKALLYQKTLAEVNLSGSLTYKESDFGSEFLIYPTGYNLPVMTIEYPMNIRDTVSRLPQTYVSLESATRMMHQVGDLVGFDFNNITYDSDVGTLKVNGLVPNGVIESIDCSDQLDSNFTKEPGSFFGIKMVKINGVIVKAFFIGNIKATSSKQGFMTTQTYLPDELGYRITYTTQSYPYSVTTDKSPKKVTWCCATIYGSSGNLPEAHMTRIVWADGSEYNFAANEKVAIYFEIPLGRD